MFKKKSLTGEVLHEERTAYDAILKTTALKSRAIAQELAWANAEDNPYLFTLVGKLAELQFIQLEAEKQMAETFLEVSKAFRHIFQEERMVEETKREQQNYLNKVTKLQKQLEATKKKGDQPKVQLLEADVLAQGNLYNQLSLSVEAKIKKLEIYKINLLKKGLRSQAEGIHTLSKRYQQLSAAQIELADILPDAPPTQSGEEGEKEKDDIDQQMAAVVERVSTGLAITAPPLGGIDLRKNVGSPAQSPSSNRRSLMEPFSFFSGWKEDAPRRKRVSSCSVESIEMPASRSELHHCPQTPPPPPPPSFHPPPLPPPARSTSSAQLLSTHCEIVIPASNTNERPTLAKSKSETSVNNLHAKETDNEKMTFRFEQRLEEAGLLGQQSSEILSQSPLSSSEDIAKNSEDPGYAKLMILPKPLPPIPSSKEKAAPTNFEVGGRGGGESDYADPVDALNIKPRRHHQLITHSPSPPPSPQFSNLAPPVPSRAGHVGRTSPYQSVDDIRKMREKQIREDELKKPAAGSSNSEGDGSQPDDEAGYSMPFDALKEHRTRLTVESSRKKPANLLPWQRTASNGKEASAKFLHQVGSAARKNSPEEDGNVFMKRSASTSSRFDLKSPQTEIPSQQEIGATMKTNSSPNGSTQVMDQCILETNEPLRANTGRTFSVDSALYTPAKVTKLRHGRGHIAVVSGTSSSKTSDKKT